MNRGARYFWYAILAYLALCTLELLFVAIVFGLLRSIGISLIAAIPFVVALRLLRKWNELNSSEHAFTPSPTPSQGHDAQVADRRPLGCQETASMQPLLCDVS